MRLLPKKQAEDASQQFRAAMIEERNGLANEISSLTKDLGLLRQKKALESEEVERHLAEVKQASKGQIEALQGEVRSLEERKRKALEPIVEREKSVAYSEKKAQEQLDAIAKIAHRTGEERAEVVAIKASLVDRESEVKAKEDDADRRLERIREAEEVNKRSTSDLADAWQDFRKKESELTQEMNQRTAAVVQAIAEVKAEKTWLCQERQEIEDERERINSERQKLKLAFEEGRRKGYL